MFLKLAFVFQLLQATVVFAGYESQSIKCVCSTTHCLEHKMSHCNTTGVCFSQYLDRRDGSHPVVRGCIPSKTPLLCENRKPAVVGGSWPVLLCCDSNLCNMDVVPTPPPWLQRTRADDIPKADTTERTGSIEDVLWSNSTRNESNGNSIADIFFSKGGSMNDDKRHSSSFPAIVSPVYISVLVLGIVTLVVIGIVAATVLRRNSKFYAEQYGALERQPNYFKHRTDSAKISADDKLCAENSTVLNHDQLCQWSVDETLPCKYSHVPFEVQNERT